jgi:hypothetical protein
VSALRVFLDVTAHGLGHLAQCAPVVTILRQRMPQTLQLVVRSGLPRALLESRLGPLTAYVPSDSDFGMVMKTPFDVDGPASLRHYWDLHRCLDADIDECVALLKAWRCDAVLSNIGHVAPVAALRAGLPSVVFSSLTWHEVLAACAGDDPSVAALVAAIRGCYATATRVMRLCPGTPFDGLVSTAVARPIARRGRNRRADLARALGISPERPIALLAFGGMMPLRPDFVANPGAFALIGPAAWACAHLTSIDDLSLSFEDVLASVDVVISKPGYGIVTEIACAGKPSVLVGRTGWPEAPFLVRWLQQSTCCVHIDSLQALTADTVRTCLGLYPPAGPQPRPGGEIDVANALMAVIGEADDAAARIALRHCARTDAEHGSVVVAESLC